MNTGQESPPRVIRKCKRAHVHPGKQKPGPDRRWFSLSAAVSESANVSGGQGRRVEEASAAGGSLPGLRLHQNSNQAVFSHLMANADSAEPDNDFFDMLVKCQVTKTVNFSKGAMETAKVRRWRSPPGLPFGRPALRSAPSTSTRAHRSRRGLLQPHHALSGQADGRAAGDPTQQYSPSQLPLKHPGDTPPPTEGWALMAMFQLMVSQNKVFLTLGTKQSTVNIIRS